MAGNNNYFKLREKLAEFDKEYKGKDDVFGLTQLTFPGYSSSPRLVMYAGAHIKQTVPQIHADFPRVYTGRENVFGMLSSGYKKTKSNIKILYKVPRFSDKPNHLYTLFYYDEDNDCYGMINKKNLENLTEVYGYSYNNDVMNSFEPGDTIPKDTILYKSSSYDEDFNYCPGKNTLVMYTADVLTIEDAAKARKGYADERISTEVETITCMINDNDILGNYYGDKKEYHPFPKIGQPIKDQIICFKKRIFNSQILYDFKEKNMRKINFASDKPYYVNGGGIVDDIFIYSNKELDEIPDTTFYKDIKDILIEQDRYFRELNQICKELIDSGVKVSKDINYMFKRTSDILNPEYKWREEKSNYSNMIIEFTIYRPTKLKKGSKTTGRYGNKGVISSVVEDEEMPFIVLPDGTKRYVDLLINVLGVVNRGNPFQLMEVSINHIGDEICNYIHFTKGLTYDEKINELYKFYDIFNPEQGTQLKKYYNEVLTTDEKKDLFFEKLYKEKIFVHMKILWEEEPIFEKIARAYNIFKYAGYSKVYIHKWGRDIPIMNDVIVGEMYMVKLLQTDKKSFMSRSLSGIGIKNVPEKNNKSKIHEELYAKTPVRQGEQEISNERIMVSSDTIAYQHRIYRSSPFARKDMATALTLNRKLDDFDIKDEHVNINVQILKAYLKVLGYTYEFSDEYVTADIDDGSKKEHYLPNGDKIVCTDTEWEERITREAIEQYYAEIGCFGGSVDEYNEFIKNEINKVMMEKYSI